MPGSDGSLEANASDLASFIAIIHCRTLVLELFILVGISISDILESGRWTSFDAASFCNDRLCRRLERSH